jgi:hypothetical protein
MRWMMVPRNVYTFASDWSVYSSLIARSEHNMLFSCLQYIVIPWLNWRLWYYNLLIINARYWNKLVYSIHMMKINTLLTLVIRVHLRSIKHMYDCFSGSKFLVLLNSFSGEDLFFIMWILQNNIWTTKTLKWEDNYATFYEIEVHMTLRLYFICIFQKIIKLLTEIVFLWQFLNLNPQGYSIEVLFYKQFYSKSGKFP